MSAASGNLDYINSLNYKDHEDRIHDLMSTLKELTIRATASRRLRYVEIDIEGERQRERIQADELYIPQHIIDTNIRREQSAYIQYITQAPRAAILSDFAVPSTEPSLIEKDLSNRLRFDGWQLSMYPCIDGFQQYGYGVMEVIYDETKPGHVAHEYVQMPDFGFVNDTRDIQECELIARSYFMSRTKILALVQTGKFNATEAEKIIDGKPDSNYSDAVVDARDKSLFKLEKIMFRVQGTVHVAWTCEHTCDDWLSAPVPLFIGRRKPYKPEEMQSMVIKAAQSGQQLDQNKLSQGQQAYETEYPYTIFPYLISENDTISQLKGRVYLDQDTQEAASSLMSSFCTAHRRASNMYFSKDTDDPNADLMLQKNVYFEPGALINAKIKQFQLIAPDAEVMQAILAIVSANQNETSQVNFAAQNRKDSRKTATEISAATQSQQTLSTVQVVLFSNAVKSLYDRMFSVIQSRVVAGLITDVDSSVKQLYGKVWMLKPAGDVDVLERQQMIQTMMSVWPVVSQTPAASAFMCDLIQKMFPEQAMKYIQILQQAQQVQAQQQQSQQAQQTAQMKQMLVGLGEEVKNLDSHPEYFSEIGRVNALPKIQDGARMVKQIEKQQKQ